jgi:cytochrome bd-type quinol oxidase subunit 1
VLNIKVPHLLSLLAFDRPGATVRGLDTFPKADRTPLAPSVRLAFIGMVGIGTGLVVLSLWYRLRRRLGSTGPEDRLTLMAVAAAGPAAFLANELGWLVSELGRQPWTVYGVFRTSSGDYHRSGPRRHLYRVHAPLHQPDGPDGLERAADRLPASRRAPIANLGLCLR